MANLIISNNLCTPTDPAFQFSDDGGRNWKSIPCNNPPTITLPTQSFDYRFKIAARKHDSSIAISLKGFPHTMELVDKCQNNDNYTLLRFVPKPDDTGKDPDILVEALPSPKASNPNTSISTYDTGITFENFKYQRNANLKKTDSTGLIFSAQCSCLPQNNMIHIGPIFQKDLFDVYLEGNRPKNLTDFAILLQQVPNYVINFIDYQNNTSPHIELWIVCPATYSPQDVNITIQGNE